MDLLSDDFLSIYLEYDFMTAINFVLKISESVHPNEQRKHKRVLYL